MKENQPNIKIPTEKLADVVENSKAWEAGEKEALLEELEKGANAAEEVAEGFRDAEKQLKGGNDGGKKTIMDKLRFFLGKNVATLGIVLATFKSLDAKANETKAFDAETNATEISVSGNEDEAKDTYEVSSDELKGGPEARIVKQLNLSEDFELGVGDLDNTSFKQMEEKVDSFIENLSQDEIENILNGKIILRTHGEASHEPLISSITTEDGTVIQKGDNEALAHYRALQPVKIFIQKLREKGYNVDNINIEVTYPKGGVSKKDVREARLELRVALEKTTENVLTKIKDKTIAALVDESGSIDKKETQKINEFINEVKEKNKDFKRITLEGGDLESHLITLSHLFYKTEGFKEKEGIIYIPTDERDASLHGSVNVLENYGPQMEDLMKKYKETGKKVLVQVFNPEGDGSFKMVDLTENPLALQIEENNIRDYKKEIKNPTSEDAKRWYQGLHDDSDELLNSNNDDASYHTYFVKASELVNK